MREHNEKPIRRTNPSGREVWIARYTARDGKRRSAGTFTRKKDAQQAINAAYEQAPAGVTPTTVGAYLEVWQDLHPRMASTNATNRYRMTRLLNIEVDGIPLRAWPIADLKRRHVNAIVAELLTDQKRSARGAANMLRALSCFIEDAINDQLADSNPVRGVRVSASDPRVTKAPREVRVWTIADMHRFAKAAGEHEAMVRTITDCGLRLGEVLPRTRADLHDGVLEVRSTAYRGQVIAGTKTDHGEPEPGRVVPVPEGLQALLRLRPTRIDTLLLFPTLRGKVFWARNFYRDVWEPAQKASGLDMRPHECRHSWISHMTAAGLDPSHIAEVSGHNVETQTRFYRHAVGESFDAIRAVIG